MAFTVTSMQRFPDIGFSSVSRHTAEGARELATYLAAQGAVEIEVRDDRGVLRSLNDLGEEAQTSKARERDILRRLAPH